MKPVKTDSLDNFAETAERHKERFRFEWPGKEAAIKSAREPATQNLVPVEEESLHFNDTRNLYIEGDNLEALKVLQDKYSGKIKMIYIDPPYNTGNDFVYNDKFRDIHNKGTHKSGPGESAADENALSSRNHSIWLSMMYPRLMLARQLLARDGAIFISIDDHELHHLRVICDEIFGASNLRNTFAVRRYDKNLNRQFMANGLKTFNVGFEYILCFAKSEAFEFQPVFREPSQKRSATGYWKGFWNDADRPTMRYDILGFTPETGQWKWKQETALEAVNNYKEYLEHFSSQMSLEEYWIHTGMTKKFIRRNPNGKGKNKGVENWIAPSSGILRSSNWTDLLVSKSDETSKGLFDFPKNVEVIKTLINTACKSEGIILDFFAGSSTTAHAVMELNVQDGGERSFILVQIPEDTHPKSHARKEGYENICQIGKERINRVVDKLKGESAQVDLGYQVFRLENVSFPGG